MVVERFFESINPTPDHQKIASYFYSLKYIFESHSDIFSECQELSFEDVLSIISKLDSNDENLRKVHDYCTTFEQKRQSNGIRDLIGIDEYDISDTRKIILKYGCTLDMIQFRKSIMAGKDCGVSEFEVCSKVFLLFLDCFRKMCMGLY